MKNKNKVKKEDFLNVLKSLSVKDMQRYIEEKGKEPKCFNPMMHDRSVS